MASDLISREALVPKGYIVVDSSNPILTLNDLANRILSAPAVDAIPIDIVAEMLADLFGDECACNYNHIDQTLAMGCERDSCPDDGDYSCWKKYVEYYMKSKMDGGKQDGEAT